jgi:hypothetical protein
VFSRQIHKSHETDFHVSRDESIHGLLSVG